MPPYIHHKKQNWWYLLIGTKLIPKYRSVDWSKKVLFLPYLSFDTKKSLLVGGIKSDFSVSLCPFFNFYTHRHKMDTELDNNMIEGLMYVSCSILI